MIQRNISRGESIEINNSQQLYSQKEQSVDEIFAAADQAMLKQNKSLFAPIKKKKKRRHPILRVILFFILFSIILIGAIVGIAVYSFKQSYPSMKTEFLSQIEIMQTELLEIDDVTLTVDQYYQKQLLLLFSVDEIDAAIDDAWELVNFIDILENPNGAVDMSLIPENKLDEYNKLVDEYHKAKQEETAAQQESANTSTTQCDESYQPTN